MLSNPYGDFYGSNDDLPESGTVRGHGMIVNRSPPYGKLSFELESRRIDDVARFVDHYRCSSRMLLEKLDFIEETYSSRKDGFERIGLNEKDVFEDIAEEIRELENSLSKSVRYLPDFNVKICQEQLNLANERYQKLRNLIMPKKKFGFKARKKQEASSSKQNPTSRNKKSVTVPDSPREMFLKERRIWTIPTSELSLDISNIANRYVCEEGSRVNKRDITLNNLKHCFVELRGHPGSLRVKGLNDCVILCGPTTFSIYGEDCHNTTFAIACHQFRLHYSTKCSIYLHVTSRAIIEGCRNLEIGLYNWKYDTLEQDYKDSGLDFSQNFYKNVGDFDWLTEDAGSPNYELVDKTPSWDEIRQQFKNQIAKMETTSPQHQ